MVAVKPLAISHWFLMLKELLKDNFVGIFAKLPIIFIGMELAQANVIPHLSNQHLITGITATIPAHLTNILPGMALV